ncbi:hypothetical protein BE08_14250 [Sorangium cellulosum]|uniref:Uncharacterized protein n=1 Tax=Sorangium cellulosum TaxID=56 RepID=A0A150PMW0_SORCE|nr:hypothetical protein BE08_14250 [Sorangium cellulosum]
MASGEARPREAERDGAQPEHDVHEPRERRSASTSSEREIALAATAGRSTVGEYLARAKAGGLTWEVAKELDDAEVEGGTGACAARSERQVFRMIQGAP